MIILSLDTSSQVCNLTLLDYGIRPLLHLTLYLDIYLNNLYMRLFVSFPTPARSTRCRH